HVAVHAPPVRERVDVGQREARGPAGAAGSPRLAVERGEEAVARDASPDLRVRRGPVARRQVLLAAVEHQVHGRAGLPGQPGAGDALHVRTELAAEAAAHVLGDDADIRLRDAEARRETFGGAVDGLRAHPGRQPVAFPLAHAAVRLERHVGLHLGAVGLLDDAGGALEAGLDAVLFLGFGLPDVAAL